MKRAMISLGVATAILAAWVSHGLGQQRGRLSGLMRPKLDHAKGVLEGLAIEDYAKIAKNAQALKELSEAAEWRVLPTVAYLRFSGEFQRLADELMTQAKRKDIEGATLAYVQLTINCVNCNKHLRENKILPDRSRERQAGP
jgi:hypothetical protein